MSLFKSIELINKINKQSLRYLKSLTNSSRVKGETTQQGVYFSTSYILINTLFSSYCPPLQRTQTPAGKQSDAAASPPI